MGVKGEVKHLNPGFVRLKLFPEGSVLYATPENVAQYSMVSAWTCAWKHGSDGTNCGPGHDWAVFCHQSM